MKVQTINAEMFRDCVFIKISLSSFGEFAKVKNADALAAYLALLRKEAAQDGAATPAVMGGTGKAKATKRIIESKPLEELKSKMNELKAKVCGQFGIASPSRISEGLFVLQKNQIETAEKILEEGWTEVERDFLPKAVADYTPAIARAQTLPVSQGGLGPLFNSRDYVSEAEFRNAFKISWQWLALGVPDDLPAQLRQKATEQMEKQMSEAAEEVKLALRESFAQLIAHATDKLTVQPGGKPKVFRDSLIGNVQQFIEVFNAKNLMNDQDLANLVEKAKTVLAQGDINAQKLRDSTMTRDKVRQQFGEIKNALDNMITDRASRQITFDDDATPAEAV